MYWKDLRKICHPEAKILNSLVNCSKTKLLTDGQTDGTRSRVDPTSSGVSQKLQKGVGIKLFFWFQYSSPFDFNEVIYESIFCTKFFPKSLKCM